MDPVGGRFVFPAVWKIPGRVIPLSGVLCIAAPDRPGIFLFFAFFAVFCHKNPIFRVKTACIIDTEGI